MGNFCTNCGTRLVNGVCPNCSAAQPAAQYQQPVPQYQQPAPQNQQPAPQYQQPAPQYQQPAPQAEQSVPLYQHIGNNMPKKKRKIDVLQEPSEKYLFVLGNKNFKKFMRMPLPLSVIKGCISKVAYIQQGSNNQDLIPNMITRLRSILLWI